MIEVNTVRLLDMDEQQAKQLRAKNIRTALVLAALALAFLLGMVLRRMA